MPLTTTATTDPEAVRARVAAEAIAASRLRLGEVIAALENGAVVVQEKVEEGGEILAAEGAVTTKTASAGEGVG